MPSYLRRRWSEPRGDRYSSWGESWWYFEIGSDGTVLRQIEQYDSGVVLRYSKDHIEDQYGALADQQLDLYEPEWQTIDRAEFQRHWQGSPFDGLDQVPGQPVSTS